MLVNGVADNISGLVSQGIVDDVMANGVGESVSQGMGRESVSRGMGSGLMDNGVSESVPQGVVNGVGVDGVRGNGFSEGMINGGSGLMANGVSESIPHGVVNGVGVNDVRGNGVSEGMINDARDSGQATDVSATEIDKDHLLACFNQEVHEDLARLRVYRSLANGLRVAIRMRRHRITRLEALGNCEDAARTVRFWERMQLDNVEKGTRALLVMKETEAKIGEKASIFHFEFVCKRLWCFLFWIESKIIFDLDSNLGKRGQTNNSVFFGKCVMSKRFLMAELPQIDELRRAASSSDWENMFMLYCRRAIVEDERLAWDINGLCAGLTARIEERWSFIDELDVLADKDGKMNKWLGQESLFLEILKNIVYGGLMEVIASLSVVASAAASDAATSATMAWLPPMRSTGEDYRLAREINRVEMEVNGVVMAKDQFIEELDSLGTRHVPSKMAEFLREIQRSDKETVAKLQILVREMELNARKKDLFIQKLDGLIPY
uniref:Membrane protein of ER body-like protein n=1 Tax=Tanacetum cinerariifolium TaxID=118510 RepID=A0A6L2MDS5_TANCI|nr:membrane protein of ER body-like protein [Tanacetum cinerariifolium]